ncbi:TonB-dependent receptor [Pedobacter montanisoli]|uniref:TonB-dependent receptor n=1 Tax=Pedobacter montanisoli TaxID=2923277 RepID=A0ABS9ZZ56_9SPHI|nr:TonB-dependent receptor [Pedobacter montanisoli]MCJ0743596.1 TonB-dependent receptor [Pedobacter montanisoli]
MIFNFKFYSLVAFFIILNMICVRAQTYKLQGSVSFDHSKTSSVTIALSPVSMKVHTDTAGNFMFLGLKEAVYQIKATAIGYKPALFTLALKSDTVLKEIVLEEDQEQLQEVVITGTQKEVSRLESPVPVEIYSANFFKRNPAASVFEALQNINGVRPQLNCNICNTGDIHINGLEGPYTMVLIDGMPIVSGLSTVYGLSGIPTSIIERVEVVKGPASSLYGSEAVGGLINIITKKVSSAPKFSVDLMSNTHLEHNADLGFKLQLNSKVSVLTGINYFNFNKILDRNQDHFTDMTLQNRIALFQKWNIERRQNRVFSLAARYLYEDRWGGETRWNKSYRGGDEVYGESIYTSRWEMVGNYQLPLKEKTFLAFSLTQHNQNSRYGETSYIAKQQIAFSHLTWDKKINQHDLLFGAAVRYTFYKDNTMATNKEYGNDHEKVWLPGLFVQDEIRFNQKNTLLLGLRYDYHSLHGSIFTPRLAYKYSLNQFNSLRFNAGTGFRVVNIFTEDHAALTGARKVEVNTKIRPERNYNVNVNYAAKIFTPDATIIGLDVSLFYAYFTNRIVPDYESDVTKIRYDNLNGYAINKGVTANLDLTFTWGLKLNTGITYQDVSLVNDGIKQQQMLTEKFSGTWSVSYHIKPLHLKADYTGNIYGAMRLPLLSELDPRNPISPVWSIQNIQLTFTKFKRAEIYGGVKNLLNFNPAKHAPFLISRSQDPFNKNVVFDSKGQALPTADNPYGLVFDPSYVYAPNQDIRLFVGFRYNF